ncbi:MAG: L-threonylcarbamoyladenylate synthase [Prochlorothrix sp.]|nr:L-threonylcarbamoyladenylate synthase [Prochlorothrix sp.]
MTQTPIPFQTPQQLIARAKAGELVSFPTDTVPALGIRPDRAAQIFAAKQRSTQKPLILMGARTEDLWPYIDKTDVPRAVLDQWQQLMAQHWPGAVTFVLPVGTAGHAWAATLNPENPTTLGLRVPNHTLARSILQETGPLATTSANRSGEPALTNLATIAEAFPQVAVVDPQAGQSGSGQASTVVQWRGHGQNQNPTPTTASATPAQSTPSAAPASGWVLLRSGAVQLDLPVS